METTFKDSHKKYYETHKDIIRKKTKVYYNNHKEQMLENNQQYRLQNKDKIKERKHAKYEENKELLNRKDICECGSSYTIRNKSLHLKTLKHIMFMNGL